MRVLLASKALTRAIYHGKLRELSVEPDIELLAVRPDAWVEEGRRQQTEPLEPRGYALETVPLRLNGHFHLYTFRGLGAIARRFRPDVLHIDEEPYNAATVQACRIAVRLGARCVFFAWQNIARRYPPPFSWFERYVRNRAAAIAGTDAAAAVLGAKPLRGPTAVIPQFGVDPDVFTPAEGRDGGFHIGYAGRLVPAKGVDVLIDAVGRIGAEARLTIVGAGPSEAELRRQAGADPAITFAGARSSDEMPGFYRGLHVLALPTVGRPGWTEQFGRVVVEAMACGVPVIVSDAGELPSVVGAAGRVVPAGDADALARALVELREDAGLRQRLAAGGRRRVLVRFTDRRVAAATAEFYRSLCR